MRRKVVWVAVLAVVGAMVLSQAAVAEDGGDNGTEFTGVVESMPASGFVGDWVVSGTTVHVTDATEVNQEDATIAVGSTVKVEGTTETDGSVDASEIKAENDAGDDEGGNVELHGVVQSLPDSGTTGDWVVSGVTVHVTDSTQVEADGGDSQGDESSDGSGTIAVGDSVEVKGLGQPDGSVTATKIEKTDGSEGDQDGNDDTANVAVAGSAQSIPQTAGHLGTWKVSTHRVAVTRSTRIVRNGHRLGRGSHLKVFGSMRASGAIRASRVVVTR